MTSEVGYAALSIALLIIVSAFFSGAETGLTATSRARLTEIERRGSKRATMALKPDRIARTPDRCTVAGQQPCQHHGLGRGHGRHDQDVRR